MTRGNQTRHQLPSNRSRRTCHKHPHHGLLVEDHLHNTRQDGGPGCDTQAPRAVCRTRGAAASRALNASIACRATAAPETAGGGPGWCVRGGFASERDAAEALARELERLRRERRVARSLTLAELVEVYLVQHDVEPVTIEKLRWLIGKAVAAFGERPVGELRSEEIAAWRIGLSPGYRLDAIQALRQVLARAVVWGMIDVNPGEARCRQPLAAAPGTAPLESWAELDAVAGHLSPRYRPMVIFAAATRVRSAEWLALDWRDIDLEARVVYVHRSFTKGRLKCPKTEASRRAVPLKRIALQAIERQESSRRSSLVFPAERGGVPVVSLVRRRVELDQLKSSVAVRSLHESYVRADALEPHDAVHHGPSTDPSSCNSSPSSAKNSLAAGRSSTTCRRAPSVGSSSARW
jgi:integrase